MMDAQVGEDVRAAMTQAAETRSRALHDLFQKHYDSLVAIAGRIHFGAPEGRAPSPRSIVHEAFLRLVDQSRLSAGGSAFFRACCAQEFRRILVDEARRRRAAKRGKDAIVTMATCGLVQGRSEADLLHIHEAIEVLSRRNERMGRIAEQRLFGGMTVEECAHALEVSERTVVKDWAFAQQYLQKELR